MRRTSMPHLRNQFVYFLRTYSLNFLKFIYSMNFKNKNVTTSNGGSLGLWIDEERSQLR